MKIISFELGGKQNGGVFGSLSVDPQVHHFVISQTEKLKIAGTDERDGENLFYL